MSKASFNLQNFITNIKTKSLARVNRFEVFINPPRTLAGSVGQARNVSLLCEISNLPPINLSVKPFKIFGPSYQRPITSEYGGDGISMTFHVDREMSVKRFFDDWIESVVDRNSFTVNYQAEYITTIKIRQLDEADNVTYEIELLEAFPRSLTLMDLNHSAQNQTHRLNTIFAYRYWRRTDLPINQRQVDLRPKVNLQTKPVINTPPQINQTNEASRVSEALGVTDQSVSFENSTFNMAP